MSEHDDAPDPIDKAYLEAEAMLDDDEARAARRARVLAAVAREPVTLAAAAPSQARRRPDWRRGGWLAAACVAGLAVILVSQIHQPSRFGPPTAATPAPATAAPQDAMASKPAAPPPSPAKIRPDLVRSRSEPAAPSPPPLAVPAPAPPLKQPAEEQVVPPPPPPPPPPAIAADKAAADVQVQARRMAQPTPRPAIAQAHAAPPAQGRFDSSAGDRSDPASRLRAAAAAGLTAQVEALLDQGAPVDAPDDKGDTALMKCIRADQPAVAALLRRRGASLDRRNHAGESARDLATARDDARLNRALGLGH